MTFIKRELQRTRPVSHFVALLLLSILLPMIVLGSTMVWQVEVFEREQANEQALRVAQSVTAEIEREFDASITTLLALTASVALLQGNLEAFHHQASLVLSYRKLHVLLRAPDGQQVLNTRVPWGTPIPRQALSATDQQVIATRQPYISDLVIGAVTQRWVLGVSVPVIVDNELRYILSMSLDPEHFAGIISQSVPATGWIIAVSDRTGRLIARSTEHEQYVGRLIHPDVQAWSSGPQGVHRTPSLASHEVVRGYVWSKKTGWLVAGFLPSHVVDTPVRTLWRMLSLVALAITSVVVPMSYYLTKQITGPIAAAAQAARLLGQSEPVVATASRMQEANDLSKALERASVELRARARELSENEARYRGVFEQSAVGFVQVALDGKLLGLNDRLCKTLGYTREECLEKTFKLLTHPDDWAAEDELIGAMLKGDRPHYEFEKRLITKSGDPIWVRVTSAPVRDVEGNVLYRTSVVEDITKRRKSREAVARLAAIVQASVDAIVSTSLTGTVETWNPGAERLFGYAPEEIIGQSLMTLTPRTKPGEFDENLRSILRGETLKIEVKWRHKDGTIIDVAVTAAAIQTNDGIKSISITIEDVRDRKQRETQIALLNRELAHRVKNTLAVIQSIANQTMRSTPDPKEFRLAFQGRLQALSAANDLLMQTSWDGAELTDFIERQLAPLMPRNSMQLRKDGPHVRVPAELSVHLGLALHELGTNALKYGAWSVPGGQVRVAWVVQHAVDDETHRLILTWSEHNGPPVGEPERRGFGATLIERGIPDAVVERHFNPQGIICKIDLPLPKTREAFLG